MFNQVQTVNIFFLMTILFFGVFLFCLFFWGSVKYFEKSNAFSVGSDVTLTKAKVIKKFYSGGDPRIDGSPTIKLSFTHENKVHEIDKAVEKEIFFDCDEGQEIDLFISNSDELKVYPLKSIQSKEVS